MGRDRERTVMSRVTVRYWAAAKEAAGSAQDVVQAATLAEALDSVSRSREGNSRFQSVLSISSFLIDGTPVGRRTAESVILSDGSEVEVLPPFAGG
jgi:molybdopterin synthase sulfur carrier subunit